MLCDSMLKTDGCYGERKRRKIMKKIKYGDTLQNQDAQADSVALKSKSWNRRKFIKASANAGVAAMLSQSPILSAVESGNHKKRYVIVGTGSRSRMYQRSIENDYAKYAELVGFCDVNTGRLKLAQERSRQHGKPVPPFLWPRNSTA